MSRIDRQDGAGRMSEVRKQNEDVLKRTLKEERAQEELKDPENPKNPDAVSETWAEETIADLDDFIESQGIYIRQ